MLLVFPLSVIKGDLRYFDLKVAVAGYQSYELMLLPLGIGWLVSAFTPKRLILPLLRAAAVLSAAVLPLQIFMPGGLYRLEVFMAFQFLNGICAAAAFYLFCFELNNVERLFGMVIIQLYYGFLYTIWQAFPSVQAAGNTWGGVVAVAACFVVLFASPRRGSETVPGTFSGAAFAIGLHVVYYVIMCVITHVEWGENNLSGTAFGFGGFTSIVLILVIQLLNNRSALYIWLLFLVLSLAGLGVLMLDLPAARLSGSFAYGLGDGLGYIIIYYLCASSIKKSKPLKMWRLCCLVFFVEYAGISGVFARAFNRFELPGHYLAFGVVLALCSVCFLLMPLMQRKLFDVDWTDGIKLQDIAEYAGPLAVTEEINTKDHLDLTDREREIFALLLKGIPPKEIGYALKISFHTVHFHKKNLYQKLGIQSIQELFAKYTVTGGKTG